MPRHTRRKRTRSKTKRRAGCKCRNKCGCKISYARTRRLASGAKKLTQCNRYHRGHHVKKPACCRKRHCIVRRR